MWSIQLEHFLKEIPDTLTYSLAKAQQGEANKMQQTGRTLMPMEWCQSGKIEETCRINKSDLQLLPPILLPPSDPLLQWIR